MKIAFFKAKGNIWDKLIRWRTGEKYSHCELVFSDGVFFSADARTNKVRFANIIQDTEKWDFIDLPIDTFGENHIRRWCKNREGLPYDYLGVFLCHLIDLGVEDPYRYFCSEICCMALQQEKLLMGQNGSHLNPGELARLLQD